MMMMMSFVLLFSLITQRFNPQLNPFIWLRQP